MLSNSPIQVKGGGLDGSTFEYDLAEKRHMKSVEGKDPSTPHPADGQEMDPPLCKIIPLQAHTRIVPATGSGIQSLLLDIKAVHESMLQQLDDHYDENP